MSGAPWDGSATPVFGDGRAVKILRHGAAFIAAAASIGLAGQAQIVRTQTMSAADAQRATDACLVLARSLGWHMQGAILHEYGDLVRFEKMDGAKRATGVLALEKARTVFRTGRSTREMETMNPTGARLFDAVTIPGGLPAMVGERLVGVVGVSGDKPDNDEACAAAGIRAMGLEPVLPPAP